MAELENKPIRASMIFFVAAHVVVGFVSALLSANQEAISSGIFLAIVFAQSTLIGTWSGLGETHWSLRLLVGGVLAAALTFELCLLYTSPSPRDRG